MKKQVPRNTYYELQELLGEGVTSEVYKAFRIDQKTWTRQQVALKIIKSENDVQILKREFGKYLKVQSKFCVQVLAWENLPKGPSIVMEFIEGVTLLELFKGNKLGPNLVDELCCQIELGLKALHRSGVVHGDLNLKNILVNSRGVVKLIDFGFFGEGETLTTPEFAMPEVMRGAKPTEDSDFYSLGKIRSRLLSPSVDVDFKSNGISRASRRRLLSQLVKKEMAKSSQCTQIIKTFKPSERKRNYLYSMLWGGLCFLFFLVFPIQFVEPPSYGRLDVKGRRWVRISINGMPGIYGPIVNKKLREGVYQVKLTTSDYDKLKTMSIEKAQTFLLNP